jgi:DNA polymerase III sliding clamp (beta) subunit (PCNA family)
MIVELDKARNKALRWILKAAAKDQDRPILTGVYSNGAQYACDGCDGYRLHVAQVPMEEGTWRFDKVAAGAELVKAEEVDVTGAVYGRYPNVFQIIPDAGQDPEFEICVNATYLKDAIDAMRGKRGNGFVRLRFFGKSSPLEVYGELADGVPGYAMIQPTWLDPNADGDLSDDVPGYALVMPVYRDAETANTHKWRPTRPVKDATS